jgi:hypothetical protein
LVEHRVVSWEVLADGVDSREFGHGCGHLARWTQPSVEEEAAAVATDIEPVRRARIAVRQHAAEPAVAVEVGMAVADARLAMLVVW